MEFKKWIEDNYGELVGISEGLVFIVMNIDDSVEMYGINIRELFDEFKEDYDLWKQSQKEE